MAIDILQDKRILVVDDDENICRLVGIYLQRVGCHVQYAKDGLCAVDTCRQQMPDLVILDVMLPRLDGWQVLEQIRKLGQTPVIMLTGKQLTGDKVKGLEMGADDYLAKPFDPQELLARVRAVIRRVAKEAASIQSIVVDDLSVNLAQYKVILRGETLELPPKEIELLFFLASHENQVFTREQLLEKVWGFDFFGDSRTVDVHIKRLREKLSSSSQIWRIKTVWGVGYIFEVHP